ncbi:MAG: NAD(P)-dependent oxidoreductase [Actinobacteria bacterium]|nr:NAD(P)-dependent oxidoreductase [Actinomycetota bacterium]
MTTAPRAVETVGLIGAGRMGGQVGRHLRARDWPVVVLEPDDANRRVMTDLGAEVADDPADLAGRSDLVLVAVVDDAQTIDVLRGDRGVLAGARPGAVVAICASVRPDTCATLAAEGRDHDVHVLDLAMVGGERGAEAGMLTLFCGGEEAALGVCRGALAAFATNVSHLGPAGTGQIGKMVNNILLWAAIRADVEALRLGRALGADPARLRAAAAIGSGSNRVLLEWAQQRLRWPHKDLDSALELADSVDLDVPLVRTLRDLMADLSVDDLHDLR